MNDFKICILSIFYIFCFTTSYSQNDILSKKLTIEIDSLNFEETIKKISSESEIDFSFSNNIIPENEIIYFSFVNKNLGDILTEIFQKTKIEFQVIENQIILKHNPLKEIRVTEYTISGHIKDYANGETLIGANIYIPELNLGTTTNSYGFYSLTIPEGNYSIYSSFLGFNIDTLNLDLLQNRKIHIELKAKNEFLEEVVIQGLENDLTEVILTGETSIKPQTISSIPALMGESDVIKSLHSIPGIKSQGDGSTSFFVRGGNRDQNLILIDEAPVYNPSHLLGFYSTFSPEAIKDVKIYKGDIPANYGGRLSSLIDIRTKDGSMKKWGFGLDLGLISSKITLNGPLKRNKSSVFISRRKSHFRKLLGNTIDENNDIYFQDFTTKLNYIINEKNRLFYTIYYSKDVFKIDSENDANGIQWENFASTFRWNHIFSNKLFSNTTVHTSTYDYRLYTSYKNATYWNSKITNLNFKTDFTYFHNPKHTTRFGFNFGMHGFNPGVFVTDNNFEQNFFQNITERNSLESAFYFHQNHRFKNRFSLTYGLRYTSWKNFGETELIYINEYYQPTDTIYHTNGETFYTNRSLEPRISFKYKLTEKSTFKTSYIFTTQYIQLITNSVSPFTSLEVWLPSGPNIKPQKAHQITLGFQRDVIDKKALLSIETFYKKMKNQIDYVDHAKMLFNPLLEAQLRFGDSWSYGIETLIKKDIGKFTGWISYTYSRTFVKINDLNDGVKFPAYFDKPHDFAIFISYDFSKQLNISANWVYTSGAAFTSPTSFYEYNGYTVPVYKSRNNDRLPDYHRLDFAMSYRFNKKEQRFNHGINFSILNVYNHKNPIHLYFNKHYNVFGNIAIPGNQYANDLIITQSYLYTFLPSISYYLKF
jgi:TonB dependent receptor-like, beta-barrel/CarboxypepD_reg-like domain/TonB-dependent Receptor Plug Domain